MLNLNSINKYEFIIMINDVSAYITEYILWYNYISIKVIYITIIEIK